MNWFTIVIIGVLAIALITFLIIRNQKDEKQLEDKLDNDYPKSKHVHIDIDMDRKT